jgi:hypothetical protein
VKINGTIIIAPTKENGNCLGGLTLALSGRGHNGGTCRRPRTWGGRGTRPLKGLVRLALPFHGMGAYNKDHDKRAE